jgi:hypothetical protein
VNDPASQSWQPPRSRRRVQEALIRAQAFPLLSARPGHARGDHLVDAHGDHGSVDGLNDSVVPDHTVVYRSLRRTFYSALIDSTVAPTNNARKCSPTSRVGLRPSVRRS